MSIFKRWSLPRKPPRSRIPEELTLDDVFGRKRADENLGPAPCPVCGVSLVARLSAAGPYFHCRCTSRVKC